MAAMMDGPAGIGDWSTGTLLRHDDAYERIALPRVTMQPEIQRLLDIVEFARAAGLPFNDGDTVTVEQSPSGWLVVVKHA